MWYTPLFASLRHRLARSLSAAGSRRPPTGRRAPGRRGTVPPRLEALEARWCPASDIFAVDGHILQVLGDRAANRIDIIDSGPRGVSVACDGGSAQTFAGIDRIVVNTGDGNDLVNYLYLDGHAQPADLGVDLGGGDNTFLLGTTGDASLPPTHGWRVNLKTGAGNDTARVQVGGVAGLCIQLTADMGAGNDGFYGDILNRPLPLSLHFLIDLGNGNDLFQLTAGDLILPNADDPWTVDVQGGLGNDNVQATFGDVADAVVSFHADLGGGDDGCVVTHPGGIGGNGQFNLKVEAGAGDDAVRVEAHGAPDGHTLAVGPGAQVSAVFDLGDGSDVCSSAWHYLGAPYIGVMRGGGGVDRISEEWRGVHAPLSIDVDGSAGGDQVTASFVDVFAPVSYQADTGAGDDAWAVTLDGDVSAPIDMAVNLGGGDDRSSTDYILRRATASALPAVQSSVRLAVAGEAGDDAFTTFVGNPQDGIPPEPCRVELDLTNDGGRGNDSFLDEFSNVDLLAPVTLHRAGGEGSDHFVWNCTNVASYAPLDSTYDGGAGSDDIRVIFAYGTGIYRPAFTANAPVRVNLGGGLGSDAVVFSGGGMNVAGGGQVDLNLGGDEGNDLVSVVTALVTVGTGGGVRVLADGGEGRDVVLGEFTPGIMPGGSFEASLRGGGGNDLVTAVVNCPAEPEGSLQVTVAGCDGSDHLAFLARVPERFPASFRFTLDGNDGEDFAVATALVQVQNCEHVVVS